MGLLSELNLMNRFVGYLDFSAQQQLNGVDYGSPSGAAGVAYGQQFATNILADDTLEPLPFDFSTLFTGIVRNQAPDNYTLDFEITLQGDPVPFEITIQFNDYDLTTFVSTPRAPYVITLTPAAPVWTDTLTAATDSELIYVSETWRCPV